MSENLINEIISRGGESISITIKASDLALFANTVANNVAQCVIGGAVEALSEAMGTQMKYCSRKEIIKLLGCSSSTLSRWEQKKYITPLKIGGKNLYLRQEVLALMQKNG